MGTFGGFTSTVHTTANGDVRGGKSRSFASSAASVPSTSSGSGMSSGWLNALSDITAANNAFNVSQVDQMNAFNAAEAQKNRDFQERMSRNAYRYAVEDLQAAGLNPVLAALNGGAATPSGSSASGGKATADDTLGNGLISMMGAMISSNSALAIAQMQMENQRWLAGNNPNTVYGFVNRLLGDISGSSGSKISDFFGRVKSGLSAYYGNGKNGFLSPTAIARGYKAFKNGK